MTLDHFIAHNVPFVERVKWAMLCSLLRSEQTVEDVAEAIGRHPGDLDAAMMTDKDPDLGLIAEWAFALGYRPQIDLLRKVD